MPSYYHIFINIAKTVRIEGTTMRTYTISITNSDGVNRRVATKSPIPASDPIQALILALQNEDTYDTTMYLGFERGGTLMIAIDLEK